MGFAPGAEQSSALALQAGGWRGDSAWHLQVSHFMKHENGTLLVRPSALPFAFQTPKRAVREGASNGLLFI